MKLFSILIANYNNGHFFNDCYQSILAQTYTNWEVILVDDGSKDDSVAVIEEIIGVDKRFKVYENTQNKGCGYTKAKCARLANGEILGFLDPDDALCPDALQVMVYAHKKSKAASIITSNHEFVDIKMKSLSKGRYASPVPEKQSYLTYGRGALTHFASFKKKDYDKTEGIDPVMKRAVDQDLYYKMEEMGNHIFIDKILYRYRVHKNSISNNDNLWKAEYWHFYAKLKAYKRRKIKTLNTDNFTKSKISLVCSNYYLLRLERIKFVKHKFCVKIYFLGKAIWANPFHLFEHKVKSLVLILIGKI